MARSPSSASEWTAAVEAAVHAELLRRSRRLKWAVLLSLLLAASAVVLALWLRGMRWEEIAPRLQQRFAPVLQTQIAQGQAQIALAAEITRLESELQRLQADLRARADQRDAALRELQRRIADVERALREAGERAARQEQRLQRLAAPGLPAASQPAPR